MYLGSTTYPGASTYPGVPGGYFRGVIVQRRVPVIPPLMALMNFSQAVLRINGQWIETDFPTEDQINSADMYFPGGYVTPVNPTQAAALVAAGYVVDAE